MLGSVWSVKKSLCNAEACITAGLLSLLLTAGRAAPAGGPTCSALTAGRLGMVSPKEYDQASGVDGV